MSVNPGAAIAEIQDRSGQEMAVSFRVIQVYDTMHDQLSIRLDVKAGAGQFNAGLSARLPRHEGQIGMTDELIMPQNYPGLCVCVKGEDIVDALRGLADRLEQQMKDNAEAMKP